MTIDDDHLAELVQAYLANQGHGPLLDDYLASFTQRSLPEAIEHAGFRFDGKVHGHQRLVGKEKLRQASQALLRAIKGIEACESFEDLHDFVAECTQHIEGFGILAKYDFALRIGAKLGVWPDVVYLHAGAKGGCKALGVKIAGKTVKMADLPKPIQKLQPHHAENFLCIYKEDFVGAPSKPKGCLPRRSGC